MLFWQKKVSSEHKFTLTVQERFGKELTITKGGVKVGLKDVDDYGSDPDTDALADDSDLDISTCK